MADMSYLNPRTILRETKYPSAAEIARDPHRYEDASPVMVMREYARKQLLAAGGLCALGAVAFGLAVVTVSTEAPAWVAGVELAAYAVATTVGGIKHLESADALRAMREATAPLDQVQPLQQIAEQPPSPIQPRQTPPIAD